MIESALAASESGTVSVVREGQESSWNSADGLLTDFESGDRAARIMVFNLEQAREIEEMLPTVKQRARAGDPSAMMNLYVIGKNHTGELDQNEALDMLRNHPSALAQMYVAMMIEKRYDWSSREGILMSARASAENLDIPGLTPEQQRERNESAGRQLRQLRVAANDGNEDAQWVLEQLLAEGYGLTAPAVSATQS